MSHKKPKEKKKEQKRLAQKTKSLNKKKEKYSSIINTLDLEEEFKSLPLFLKEDLWNFSWPQIQVCTRNISDHECCDKLKNQIQTALEHECVEVNSKNISLTSYTDLVAFYVFSLHYHNEVNAPGIYEKYNKYADLIKRIYDKSYNIINETFEGFYSKIVDTTLKLVLQHYNFENGIYPKFITKRIDSKKQHLIIELQKISIKKEIINVDKGPRTAYLCPSYSGKEIEPVFFEKGTIGNKNKIPVYVQEHAINRLFERLSIKTKGYLLDCLGLSLNKPKISGYDGESYLIDYNFYSYKLGYLIVSNFGNIAVVRSFKFIAMTGTPEFLKIARKLKTTKHDITYLGLDTLDVFVNSDLSKDPKLVQVFTDCDLGHLFKLSEKFILSDSNLFENPRNVVADEIKKYLKL